ncbi:uncharacterized protein Bfra_011672 [Botrytis fragariae]|uniref:Mid2 domain-containing protein n=1 Tax=Botrytis fragariae TaxID=1964551 RepID=A0A8H6EE96_9HELO|nr:uncharacterized protein Bfra_011672 [Botrytis fragariae]KAF5869129.1 hypothetical protein Bfra_011672 [Botrytis fragariae]
MRSTVPLTFVLLSFFPDVIFAQNSFLTSTSSSALISTTTTLVSSTGTSSSQSQLSAETPSPALTTSISLTPAMSSSSVASFFAALATSEPSAPNDPPAGDAASTGGSAGADSDAGASGTSSGGVQLSNGAMIAIVIAVIGVCLFGIISATLFYLAKKRSWEVRKKLRASARKVAVALTPRRATFGKDVHKRPGGRGLERIDEVPPTPKISKTFVSVNDVEKGEGKMMEFELSDAPKSKWARKMRNER